MISSLFQVDRAQIIDVEFFKYLYGPLSTKQPPVLNYINTFKYIFIYGLFPIGILSNLYVMIFYLFKDYRTFPAFHLLIYCLSSILVLFLYLINYIYIDDNLTTLVAYSKYSCKLQTYIFHILTSFGSWVLVFFLFDFKMSMRSKIKIFPKLKLMAWIGICLAVVYIIDFYNVNIIQIDIRSAASLNNYSRSLIAENLLNNSSIYVNKCLFENRYVMAIIDMALLYILPVIGICIQVFQILNCLQCEEQVPLKTAESKLRLKRLTRKLITLPFVFSLFLLPVLLSALLNNFQKSQFENDFGRDENLWLKLIFTISIFLNQLRYSLLFVFYIFYDKNFRKTVLNRRGRCDSI